MAARSGPRAKQRDVRASPPFGKEVPALVQASAQREWNLPRLSSLVAARKPSFDFLTAGSSGRTPDVLLDQAGLPAFRVGLLIDIRATPFSRHTPLWNRTALESRVRSRGIEYRHRPDLGVPSEVRNHVRETAGSYGDLFSWYDDRLAATGVLESLDDVRSRHPLFLCTELGPTFCHRHRLALQLEKRWNAISFDV